MPKRSAEGPAIEVVHPSADDALVIGGVYLRSWRAGYEGLVHPVRLEPVAAERAAHDWPAAIRDPDARFALGYVDGAAAGVAKIGPDPTEAVRRTWLELLYVAPESWARESPPSCSAGQPTTLPPTAQRSCGCASSRHSTELDGSTSVRAGSPIPTSRRRTTTSSRCSACAAA